MQPRFCKVGYRPVSVQFLNSTQDNTILMMVLYSKLNFFCGSIFTNNEEQKVCTMLLFTKSDPCIPSHKKTQHVINYTTVTISIFYTLS